MATDYTLDDAQVQRANRRQGQRRTRNARRVASVPRGAAVAVTQRKTSYSGKGLLTAELLAGFVLVAIRVVADYEVQGDGTAQGRVLHPSGQYGPLPILAGLIGSFFFLSFLAAAGGTKAKMAVIAGGAIVLTLGVNTFSEILKITNTLGQIGMITVPPASGSEGSGASAANVTAPAASSSSSSGKTASGGSTAGASSLGASENALNAADRAFGSGNLPAGVADTFTSIGDLITAGVLNVGGNLKNDFSSALNSLTHFIP